MHAGTRSGLGVKLDVSNCSDRQRELRALVFFPDNRRDRHHSSDSSYIPALRYGEAEFSDEGHQERPNLRDTSTNWVSVCNLDR